MSKRKYLLGESITVIVIGMIAIFLFIALIINAFQMKNNSVLSEDISKNWICKIDGKELTNKVRINDLFSELDYNSTIEFVKEIDVDKEYIYPFIKFNALRCDARIYSNNELLFTYEYNESIISKKQCIVELPTNLDKQEIRIVLEIKDSKQKVYIDGIGIVEGNKIFKLILSENTYEILISGIILVFGIIVICITLSLKEKNLETWRMFWIGMLLLLLGVFLISRMNIISYILSGTIILEIITYVSIIVITPTVLIIHMYMLQSDRKKKILSGTFLLVFLITCLVSIFKDYVITNKNIHIGSVMGIGLMILIIVFFILLIKEYKNIEGIDKFLYKGFFIIYVIIGIIITSLIFFDFVYFIEIFNKGIVVIDVTLLLVSMVYYSYKIKDYMHNIENDKILTTLAFTDPLTGINNRTKYEEVLKKIKSTGYKMCTVVAFDLNNLKIINDKNGHEAGDEYIKEFSKVLRIGFQAEEFIGRIGGDEFIAIVKDKYMNVEEIIEMMQYLLKETMQKKQFEDEVSFAYGIAESRKNDNKSIEELIEIADKNMYECKEKQKNKE